MTKALEDLFSCTGRISTIKYDLKFGRILEGAETRQRQGELARLEGIHTELMGNLTADEKVEWESSTDKTISEEDMRKRAKQMDLENVDRDSI